MIRDGTIVLFNRGARRFRGRVIDAKPELRPGCVEVAYGMSPSPHREDGIAYPRREDCEVVN